MSVKVHPNISANAVRKQFSGFHVEDAQERQWAGGSRDNREEVLLSGVLLEKVAAGLPIILR